MRRPQRGHWARERREAPTAGSLGLRFPGGPCPPQAPEVVPLQTIHLLLGRDMPSVIQAGRGRRDPPWSPQGRLPHRLHTVDLWPPEPAPSSLLSF